MVKTWDMDRAMVRAGGLINAALFLLITGIASIASMNHAATVMVILSAGLAVLCYGQQMKWSGGGYLALVLYYASNMAAVVAAGLLVMGYLR